MSNIAVPQVSSIPKPFYRLRWRFIFKDGKEKKGVWNGVSKNVEDSAWGIKKENLSKAIIEGENRQSWEITPFLELDGHDYAFAQWEAYSRISSVLRLQGEQTPQVHISGLSFWTTTEKITVFINGSIERRALTPEDQKFKFKEHSV